MRELIILNNGGMKVAKVYSLTLYFLKGLINMTGGLAFGCLKPVEGKVKNCNGKG